MSQKKEKIIIIRLTEEEKNKVSEAAKENGMSLSSYVRNASLHNKISSKTDVKTVFELKKIGVNLNQLAKHVNTLPVDDNIREAISLIESYIKEIKLITDKLI